MKKSIFTLVLVCTSIFSCKKDDVSLVIDVQEYHNASDQLTSVIVHDIFSPPVASRIYAYSNIAAYEVIAQGSDDYESLSGQVKGLLPTPPLPEEKINIEIASLVAQMEIGKALIFSEDKMIVYRDSLFQNWSKKTWKNDFFFYSTY